jgi:hypothetical protein
MQKVIPLRLMERHLMQKVIPLRLMERLLMQKVLIHKQHLIILMQKVDQLQLQKFMPMLKDMALRPLVRGHMQRVFELVQKGSDLMQKALILPMHLHWLRLKQSL